MKPNVMPIMFGMLASRLMGQYNAVAFISAIFALYDAGAPDICQNEAVNMGIIF